MVAEFQNDSDKENAAPAEYDAHYPPLPLDAKGNIVMKHPYSNTSGREKPASQSNTSRKRHGLATLTETPPRSSRSSQISKIFAKAATPKDSVASTPLHSPTNIPDEAMRVYEHFSQAMRSTPEKKKKSSPSNQQTPKSKGKGRRKASGKKTPHSLRKPDSKRSVPPPSPASSTADSQRASELERVDSGCDLRNLSADQIAEHWPEITSAPRSESPPPLIPKPIPDPIPSPFKPSPKAKNEAAATKCQQPLYPYLSDAKPLYTRARSNALVSPERPALRSQLPPSFQEYRQPTPWAPHRSLAVDNQFGGPTPLHHSSHDIDRLTFINRKLARTDISPQNGTQRISFFADPDTPVPVNEFERAIAGSFSSTSPGLEERRKTLNIKITNPSPPRRAATMPTVPDMSTQPKSDANPACPRDDDDSSTDSWTGDEIFFPKPLPPRPLPQHPAHRISRPALTRAETESTIWQHRRPPLPHMTNQAYHSNATPMRHMRSSRFHVAETRGRMGILSGNEYARPISCGGYARSGGMASCGLASGVPLSMEEHPSSAGSDADGELEDSGSED